MPDWWLEATLPVFVFGVLLVLWVALPGRPGEVDLATKIRDRLTRRR